MTVFTFSRTFFNLKGLGIVIVGVKYHVLNWEQKKKLAITFMTNH